MGGSLNWQIGMSKRLASSICQSLSSNYIKDDIKSKPTLSAEYEIVAVAFELRDKNKFKEHLGACLDWQW